jgi:ppGpp synthetase/RelA/SpoT-type nucleotidyltranferase
MVAQLESFVLDHVKDYPRLDRVVGRAKDVDSFMDKARVEEDDKRKYTDPLNQIQDQIGVRIVSYYTADLPALQRVILDYFSPVEEKLIVPDGDSQFGYEGIHYILFIPDEIRDPALPKHECPEFFELQMKTLFQHAWAEANHDLAYKSEQLLNRDHRRKVAFTAAQAWGADHIFDELAEALLDGYAP